MKTAKERTKEIVARASAQRVQNARRNRLSIVLSAGFCLLLALILILFIPYDTAPPGLSLYANSDYYPLMQQIGKLTYPQPEYKNNFEALLGGLSDLTKGSIKGAEDYADEGGSPESPTTSSENAYREVTDNQVEGVIEGDLFKRTDDTVFYIVNQSDRYVLRSYSVAQADSELLDETVLFAGEGFALFAADAEMYLSADGKDATLFLPLTKGLAFYTAVVRVDVSDPGDMREASRMYVSGNYVSSRKIGEEFLLVTNFTVRSRPDFGDESQLLPQTGTPGDMRSLPADDILCPENAASANYTVVSRTNEQAQIVDSIAFFSFAEEVYVSRENIFVTRGYTASGEAEANGVSYSFIEDRPEIACVSYAGEGLQYKGSADIAGEVRNQYSLDEKDGTLRAVTTVDALLTGYAGRYDALDGNAFAENASLYVIDLDDFSVIASLERFAPLGESVISVRFDGEIVWVCTAIEIEEVFTSDPVFRIDLTDLTDITYTDTGTIPGYSFSLVDLTDGALLGIGYNDDFGTEPKIEIYRQIGDELVPVAAYIRYGAEISENYKAYLIDRENGLVGLHLYDWLEESSYILLHYDGTSLVPILDVPLASSYCDGTRATIIDGWLYIFTNYGFAVHPLP